MNKMICFCLFFFSFSLHAKDVLSINVNKKEKSFVVSLAANPTTGYNWTVTKYDKKLLSLKGAAYQKKQSNLIGSGGQMIFTFSLNQGKTYPAKTTLSFKYARPWEKEGGSDQSVVVHFVTKP